MAQYDTLKTMLKKEGVTVAQVAEKAGVHPSYVSLVLTGRRPMNKPIREAFEDYLGADTVMTAELNKQRDELRESLDEAAQSALGAVNKTTLDIIVPWYSTTVHAGTGAPIYGEDVRSFNVTEHYKGTAIYGVSGDSMIDAHIKDGDRVVVRLGHAFRHRDVILCRYNGELMVKGAAIVKGRIWLVPANPKYHKWEVKDSDEFQCIGTVIEIFTNADREWWDDIEFDS